MSTTYKNVLIVGGTGVLGTKISNSFLKSPFGYNVHLFVRPTEDPVKKEKIEAFKKDGAVIIYGDVDDIDSLRVATKGIDAVICVLGNIGFEIQSNIIKASVENGVKRFIPSEFGTDGEKFCGLVDYIKSKDAIRKEVEESGLEYTYIVNGAFMEYLFTPFLSFNIEKQSTIDFQNVTFPITHTDDIAALLPEILEDPASKNAYIRIASEVVNWSHCLDQFEEITNIKLKRTNYGIPELEEAIKNAEGLARFPLQIILNFAKTTESYVAINMNSKRYEKYPLKKLSDYIKEKFCK